MKNFDNALYLSHFVRLTMILGFIPGFLIGLHAQVNKVNIYGTVRELATGEIVIGARVEAGGANSATVSDEYGNYSLTISASDSISIIASMPSYETYSLTIDGSKDQRVNIDLDDAHRTLDEVIITADPLKERLNSTQMSVEAISAKTSKVLPALFGEVDIIKTIQLKAGVSAGSEGSTGLFVRGGSGDQNLIMLDEATVFNANHLFGFFSTFNTDAIKDVKLYKGGFPAQYGGRLSSVIDVRMKDGNNKKLSGTGGIGLITSRLTLEGPLFNENTTFVVSGRRTYVDIFTNLINKSNEGNPDYVQIPAYNFYDLNAKLNTKLGENDRLYLSGYFGKDVFKLKDEVINLGFEWGNATITGRWNHVFNPRLYANTSLIFANYDYNIANEISGFNFSLGSKIKSYVLKTDFTYSPGVKHQIKMGLMTTYFDFTVGRLKAGSDDGSVSFSSGIDRQGMEHAIYINDEFKPLNNLTINGGLRVSGWTGNNLTTIKPEPRFSVNYKPAENWALKAGYARMNQYIHLVANSSVSLPTDVWYPSTSLVKPQQSDQVAAGFSYMLGRGILLTNEYYYKWLKNQVDFRDGANLFANNDLDQEFEFGKGRAYGGELSIEKESGNLTGWIAYTLAFVNRGEFPGIMDGRYFRPKYDRRHDLKIVASYVLSPRWTASASWVFGSGDLAWLPSGRAFFQDIDGGQISPVTPIYGDRNSFRLPSYHRGDVGIIYKMFHKWGESNLTLSVYNVYNRRNPYFITLETEFTDVTQDGQSFKIPRQISARQISLFPVLPSLTWNFEF